MASKRCGCASDTCGCLITPGVGISINGVGSRTNPYVIDADIPLSGLDVQDENTLVRSGVTTLDFQGGGISATPGAAGEVIVKVDPPISSLPMAAGSATIPAPAAMNTPVSLTVNFPAGRFSAPPIVTVSASSLQVPQNRSPITMNNITATSVTFWVTCVAGTIAATPIHWQAMTAG